MAPLARRPLQRMTADAAEPPEMFHRPSDPPEPPPPITGSEHITTLHTEWARAHAEPAETASKMRRLRSRARTMCRESAMARITGSWVTSCEPLMPLPCGVTNFLSGSSASKPASTK